MRTRFVDTHSEFERVVDEYVERDYRVQQKTEQTATLQARDYGSLWVHLFLIVFTVGFGNVLYALYRRLTCDNVEVRVR